MEKVKKYMRLVLLALAALTYIYFFILNNFHFDLLSKAAYSPKEHREKYELKNPVPDSIMYHFKDVEGPLEPTRTAEKVKTSWRRYNAKGRQYFSIYLTDTNSAWLGLVHAFKSFGIPVALHTNLDDALESDVVMLYPIVSGRNIDGAKAEKITGFLKRGKTLFGVNVVGSLLEMFGIGSTVPGRKRYEAKLVKGSHPVINGFKQKEEKRIAFGQKESFSAIIGSNGYNCSNSVPLIKFDDGTSLLIYRKYNKGSAYSWSIDIGEFFLRCQNSRGFNAEHKYVNSYEPSMDVMMRIMAKIYRESSRYAVEIGTVPFNKRFTLALTHDIDFTRSITNAVKYSNMEKKMGVKATYYIQTKYVKDWNDDIFYNEHGVSCVREVMRNGMEIGSHSVSHSYCFADFPYGTGKEKYPGYRPFVVDERKALNGTILGELRVSKFLLENFNKKLKVVSFRAGYLSYPFALPEALVSTGFRNSSDVTANSALTHLPFELNYDRGFDSETGLFEYPVTFEDEEGDLLKRLPATIKVCNKIAAYGGFVCVLIHTDTLGGKLSFEEKLIKKYKKQAWFSTIGDFDRWWSARNKVGVEIIKKRDVISLVVNSPEYMEGLTVRVPDSWELLGYNKDIDIEDNIIIFRKAKGRIELEFVE